LIIDTVFLF